MPSPRHASSYRGKCESEVVFGKVRCVLILSWHHCPKETYIFPLLAKKMPAFAHDDSHRKEHQVMHHRLETYEHYIQQVAKSLGKKSTQQGDDGLWAKDVYDADKMKTLIDELGQALFPHLKAEEESLKAKSMREAGWTEAEVNKIMI